MKLFLPLVMLFVTFAARADQWYGFCFAQVSGTNYCNAIKEKDSDFDDYCRDFAESISAYQWKMYYATSVSYLQDKQSAKCDEVLGAGDEHTCYVSTYCSNNGAPTSSLTPINYKVFAPNKEKALKECLRLAKDRYYQYFKNNSLSNCTSQAQAF